MRFVTYSDRPLDDYSDLSIRRQPSMMNESHRLFGVPLDRVYDLTIPFDQQGKVGNRLIKEYIDDLADDEIVLWTDSWDAFFAGTPIEMEEAFTKIGKPLVFSTEVNLWPPECAEFITFPEWTPTRFKYACSGGWAGRVWAIKQMFSSSDYWQSQCLCSQDALNHWFSLHQDLVALDYWCQLFICLYDDGNHGDPPCLQFDIKDGRLHNHETDSYPMVIHGGGGFCMETLRLWDMLKETKGWK